jgi:hypothetical protein
MSPRPCFEVTGTAHALPARTGDAGRTGDTVVEPYQDPSRSVQDRVEELLTRLAPDFPPFNGDPQTLHGLVDNPHRIHVLAPGQPYHLHRSPVAG